MKNGRIHLSNTFEEYSLDGEKQQFKTVQNISCKDHNIPKFEPIRVYSKEELRLMAAWEKASNYHSTMMSRQRRDFKKGDKTFKCLNCKALLKADESNCHVCGFRTDHR